MSKAPSTPISETPAAPCKTVSLFNSTCGWCGSDDATAKCAKCGLRYCNRECQTKDWNAERAGDAVQHRACCGGAVVEMNVALHLKGKKLASDKITESRPSYYWVSRQTVAPNGLKPHQSKVDQRKMEDSACNKAFLLCQSELREQRQLSCYCCNSPWVYGYTTCHKPEFLAQGSKMKVLLDIHLVPLCLDRACTNKVQGVLDRRVFREDGTMNETGFYDGAAKRWYPSGEGPSVCATRKGDAFLLAKESEHPVPGLKLDGPLGELFNMVMSSLLNPQQAKRQLQSSGRVGEGSAGRENPGGSTEGRRSPGSAASRDPSA